MEGLFQRVNRDHMRSWLSEQSPIFQPTLDYAVFRFRHGTQLLSLFREHFPDHLNRGGVLLDIGGGNGGVVLPFAADGNFLCHSFDLFIHWELRQVLKETGLPLRVAVARAESLPYADASFDVVLYIETIEHVSGPKRVGAEICRVLKPQGLCLVTTPPRLPFLLRPDPHYHVKYMLLLPNFVQRWIVGRVARRGTPYEVSHIYWSLWGILRKLPGLRLRRVFPGGPGRRSHYFNWSLIVVQKD